MSDETATETITLTQVTLGLMPYTLVRLGKATDGSGGLSLFVDAGGGSEDQPLYLPLLAIVEASPEGNPVAEMLRDVYRETGPTSTGESTVEKIVREFNPDWLTFVTGNARG